MILASSLPSPTLREFTSCLAPSRYSPAVLAPFLPRPYFLSPCFMLQVIKTGILWHGPDIF